MNINGLNDSLTGLIAKLNAKIQEREKVKVFEEIKSETEKQEKIKDKQVQHFVLRNPDYVNIIKNLPNDEIKHDLCEDLCFFIGYEDHKEKLNKALADLTDESFADLKRTLHTFKGDAATVGLFKVQKEIHFLEDELINFNGDQQLLDVIRNRLFDLYEYIDNIKLGQSYQFLPFAENKAENINAENLESQNENIEIQLPVEKEEPRAKEIAKVFSEIQKINKEERKNKDKLNVFLEDINLVIDQQTNMKSYFSDLNSKYLYLKDYLEEMKDLFDHFEKNVKELAIYSETNIQSTALKRNSAFDPLQMDKFTKLQELSKALEENVMDFEDLRKRINIDFKEQYSITTNLNQMLLNSNEILNNMRLTEFSLLRDRFNQTVTGVARKLNKNVEFKLIGDVKVDVTISDKLKGAIEHIIRNSLTHGIEDVAERKRLKKPVKGQILIEAKQDANNLFLKISDDGHGLNVEKIRQKAIQKGFWKENDPFTVENAIQFILMRDFSTADSITLEAGKGVGMDVVQDEILKLGGDFTIESEEYKGMSVYIKIPTSYTSTYGLVCRVGDEKIVLLNESIKEILSIDKETYSRSVKDGRIDYNNKKIDFRKLGNVLKIPHQESKEFFKIIVLEDFAVYVDEIVENKEIVIQQKNPMLDVGGLLGITNLSDGLPVFVFDLIKMRDFELRRTNSQHLKLDSLNILNDNKEEQNKFSFLIVDDSAVVRKHTEKFLDKYNYYSKSAKNGKEALDILNNYIPDVILLDIEMPVMDGFEFAKIIRENELYKHIPIIMITSRRNSLHKQEAEKLGVNEYLNKPFNPVELKEIIDVYEKRQ